MLSSPLVSRLLLFRAQFSPHFSRRKERWHEAASQSSLALLVLGFHPPSNRPPSARAKQAETNKQTKPYHILFFFSVSLKSSSVQPPQPLTSRTTPLTIPGTHPHLSLSLPPSLSTLSVGASHGAPHSLFRTSFSTLPPHLFPSPPPPPSPFRLRSSIIPLACLPLLLA